MLITVVLLLGLAGLIVISILAWKLRPIRQKTGPESAQFWNLMVATQVIVLVVMAMNLVASGAPIYLLGLIIAVTTILYALWKRPSAH